METDVLYELLSKQQDAKSLRSIYLINDFVYFEQDNGTINRCPLTELKVEDRSSTGDMQFIRKASLLQSPKPRRKSFSEIMLKPFRKSLTLVQPLVEPLVEPVIKAVEPMAKNAFEEIVKDVQSDAIEVAAKVIETIVDIVT
jgi:hypothetical protein